jgi:hypothetical protein
LTARRAILYGRVDRDWPDTGYRSPLVQTVASDKSSILFGHHAEKAWMREHRGEDADGNFRAGEIVREPMLIGDRAEGLKTDSSARFSIGWSCPANDQRLLPGVQGLRLHSHRGTSPRNFW